MLSEYVSSFIGINVLDPGNTEAAKLVEVQAEYFTLQLRELEIGIPYDQIIKVVRSLHGNVSMGMFKGEFPLVIRVFDFVIYKGAIGFGMSVPI